MKKLIAFIALLLITLTLASCAGTEDESFTISNYTISRIQTILNEKTQYDSKFNATSENTEVFADTKAVIGEYELNMLNDQEVCESTEKLSFAIDTNNGPLLITSSCIVIDDEDTIITVIEFDEEFISYTSADLFSELRELF